MARYRFRWRQCHLCGTWISGRYPPYADVTCIDCGVALLVETSMQMMNHAGPRYDKWRQSAGPRGRPRKNPPKG